MSRALIVLDTEFQRRKAADWVWSLKHGTRVEFKAPKRTDDQNSLMWVLLTKMSVSLKWHGRHLTPDDWKLQFLDALRRAKNEELRIVPNIDNTGFVNLSMSSSDLSKEEMSDLIELIYKFGAEHGVELGEQESQSGAPTSEGSDGDAPRPNTPDVAAAPIEPAEAADQEAGEPEADHGDTAAPASDLIALKRECIDKFLTAATDPSVPDAKDRQETVVFAKDAWKQSLPTEPDFVRACFETSRKVVRGELNEAAARKYLESLL